jgi:hypothetical protein
VTEPFVVQIQADLPAFLVAAIVPGLLLSLASVFFVSKEARVTLTILIMTVSTLGAVAGFAGGLSRVGVVGDVIPAALTLLGGLSVYLFGADRSKGVVVSLCSASFALALLLGYSTGTGRRTSIEHYETAQKVCFDAFTNSGLLANSEAFCRFSEALKDICSPVVFSEYRSLFH